MTVINKAKVPEEVKEARGGTHVFEEGRVAAAGKDIATAKAKLAEYTRQVASKKRPFEVRQQHELAGMVALAEKQSAGGRAGAPAREPAGSRESCTSPRWHWKGAGEAQRAAEYRGKGGEVQRAELQLRLRQEHGTETIGNLGDLE